MNFLPAVLTGGEAIGAAAFRLPVGVTAPEGRVEVGIRPHDLSLAGPGAAIPAVVDVLEPLGPEVHVHATVGGAAVSAVLPAAHAAGLAPGAEVVFRIAPDRIHLFDAETGARLEGA